MFQGMVQEAFKKLLRRLQEKFKEVSSKNQGNLKKN
jgi:hypothetical protein